MRSMSDYQALREQFERDLHTLLGTHDRISNHLRNLDRDLPKDWSDMAQFVENDEVLELLEERTRERVDGLRRAIDRIDAGTYATCSVCASDISTQRLEVLPTTTVCAAHA